MAKFENFLENIFDEIIRKFISNDTRRHFRKFQFENSIAHPFFSLLWIEIEVDTSSQYAFKMTNLEQSSKQNSVL